jgi:hypothetical protein
MATTEEIINLLYKNYKGVPFTRSAVNWENEMYTVGISGNTMFQNDYIIFENILLDKIPKEKNQKFEFLATSTYKGPENKNKNSNFKNKFVGIDKSSPTNSNIYGTQLSINTTSFCMNILQYYNIYGEPILQKFIDLRLEYIEGTKYNGDNTLYRSWYRFSNDGTYENLLKNALPEFLGTWDSASNPTDDDKTQPVYQYVLKYYDDKTIIDKSKYHFDLKNGIISFFNYETEKDKVNSNKPPLLTFVKYIGKKTNDINDLVQTNQVFNNLIQDKSNFENVKRVTNTIINHNRGGILLDLSGIGYLKVPYKDTVYADDDIYKTIGAIRYDTVENAFEGFHGDSESGEWKPLGGGSGSTTDGSGTKILVYDVSKKEDENGYYTDKIQFYTNNQERMVINKEGDIQINGDIDMSTRTLKVNTLEVGSEIGDTLTAYDIYCDDITCDKIITNEDISCNKNIYIKENLYVHGDIHLDIDGNPNTVLQVLDNYVKDISNVLTNLILDAPVAFDTLKEISDQIKTDGTLDALIQLNLTEINKKYTKGESLIEMGWLHTTLQETINNAGAWSENVDGDIYYNDNVGIGTTSPKAKLQVNGNILFGDGTGGGGYTKEKTYAIGLSGLNNEAPSIDDYNLWNNPDSFSGIIIHQYKWGGTQLSPSPYRGHYLGFYTHNIDYKNNDKPKMVISYDGNVGIGVDNPSNDENSGGGPEKLQVNGDVKMTGNVGIGSTSPITKLDIRRDGGARLRLENSSGDYAAQNQAIEFCTTYATTGFIHQKGEDLRIGTIGGNSGKILFYTKNASGYDNGTDNNVAQTESLFNTTYTQGNDVPKMTIDLDGNVGIGSTSPGAKLHVNGNVIFGDRGAYDSQTHTDALLVLGGTHNTHYNNTNKIKLLITGDNNDGGSPYDIMCEDENGYETFWLKSPPNDNGINGVLYMKGKIGIGTGDPKARLHVVGEILATDDITAFYGSSDKRLKTNINTIENAVEIVQQLRGVRFNWNEEARKINEHVDLEKKEIGVIAQEIEEHLPEIVKKGLSDYKAIRYEKITPVLIEAIKEQQQQIKAQQQQINEQQQQIKAQQQQIHAQQQQINEILNRLNQHNV